MAIESASTARSTSDNDPAEPSGPPRHQIRLPGFLGEDDIGLGDVIKRATASVGIKPCGGCNRRAAALNRWLAIGRRPPK